MSAAALAGHGLTAVSRRCKMKYDGPKWRLHYRQQPRYYKVRLLCSLAADTSGCSLAVVRQGTAGGQCIQFGACRDSQTAADTTMLSGHTSTGAATFMFISAIEQFGPRVSHFDAQALLPTCSASRVLLTHRLAGPGLQVSYANLLGSMTRHLEEMSPHQKMHLGQSFGGTFGSLVRPGSWLCKVCSAAVVQPSLGARQALPRFLHVRCRAAGWTAQRTRCPARRRPSCRVISHLT